jgi:acyl carrier protein
MSISEKVREITTDYSDVLAENITDEMKFADYLDLNSLDIMEMLIYIEEYDIKVPS